MLLILVVAAALVLAGCKATRAGYKSATYWVVRSSGKFQVLDYPALTVVETFSFHWQRGGRQFQSQIMPNTFTT